jgi:hypothetical protein
MKRLAIATLLVLSGRMAVAGKPAKHAAAEKASASTSTSTSTSTKTSTNTTATATATTSTTTNTSTSTSTSDGEGKKIKTKTYTFGAMDVEGKLKTPQLLYFLNRVKLELDMSAPDTRSFMKELEKSADDKNL